MTGFFDKPAFGRNNGSRPAYSRNNNSKSASNKNNSNKPASRENDGNTKIDEFGGDGMEYTKKSEKSKKLSKSKKSKSKKLAKSKKLLQSGNLPKFHAKKIGPRFLTSDAKTTFNCLRLAFTKALILWHFNQECHI